MAALSRGFYKDKLNQYVVLAKVNSEVLVSTRLYTQTKNKLEAAAKKSFKSVFINSSSITNMHGNWAILA